MISTLFTILKMIGIILLVLLAVILFLVLLVLFVPIRYRITVKRALADTVPVRAQVKVTWLLHILNAAFFYPEAAYVRVRVFCFTVFRSDKKKEPAKQEQSERPLPLKQPEIKSKAETESGQSGDEPSAGKTVQKNVKQPDSMEHSFEEKQDPPPKAAQFFKKLLDILKNIKYTILKIYDRIKHIIRNIRHYIKILQSETFHRAWDVCSLQALTLLKSILPHKIRGELLIGTGDPASTGQVMAVYGILYPILGNHINVIPDFEQQVITCDLSIKGKITIFRIIKTAWIIYFNKDLRRLIKLLKREAV